MLVKRNYWKQAEVTEGTDVGGGTDTAETPVETATETTTEVDDSGVNDWADLANDDEDVAVSDDGVGVDEPPTPEPVATPPAEPAKPEVTAEPVAPSQPAEPVAPVPAEPVAVEAPAIHTKEQIAKMRQDYQAELTNFYQLSPEDAEAFATEPERVLPVLAAKVHLDVLDAVMAQLPQRVGAIVQAVTESTRVEAEAEREFFAPFPDLQPYKAQVLQVGRMFRAANPTASKEEAIRMIGNIVRQSLNLPTQAPAAPTPTPQPSAAPMFRPATSSGQGNIPVAPSIWDEMAEPDD